jgi:hypothetical protein
MKSGNYSFKSCNSKALKETENTKHFGKSSTLTAGLVPILQHREIGTREPLPIVLQVYSGWERALGNSLAEALKKKSTLEFVRAGDLNLTAKARKTRPRGLLSA